MAAGCGCGGLPHFHIPDSQYEGYGSEEGAHRSRRLVDAAVTHSSDLYHKTAMSKDMARGKERTAPAGSSTQ